MLSDGTLWSWGNNHGYQLGDRFTNVPQAAPMRFLAPRGVIYRFLATGAATSYAISTTGNVYAWGVSFEGQAGDGRVRVARIPVLIARGAAQISATVTWPYPRPANKTNAASTVAARLSTRLRSRRSVPVACAELTWDGAGLAAGSPGPTLPEACR